MNGWHEMLPCICFPSLLKQKVSVLLCWLALAAGDGNDATLPFPAARAGLALSTLHLLGTAPLGAMTDYQLVPHHTKPGAPSCFPCKNQNEMISSLTNSSEQTAEGFSCS